MSQQDRHKDAFPLSEMVDSCLREIYKRCGDSTTKRSLRHACQATYRSPAINSQLKGTCTLGSQPLSHFLGSTEHLASLFRAFPKHATLRSLLLHMSSTFGSVDDDPPETGATLQNACTEECCRDRLSTVEELCLLEDCEFPVSKDGLFLTRGIKVLFPRLRVLQLSAHSTTDWPPFLFAFTSDPPPHLVEVTFLYNNFMSWAEDSENAPSMTLLVLGRLTNLRKLYFGVCWAYDAPRGTRNKGLTVDLHPLSRMRQLQELHVDLPRRCRVEGVQASCPQLTSLRFDSLYGNSDSDSESEQD